MGRSFWLIDVFIKRILPQRNLPYLNNLLLHYSFSRLDSSVSRNSKSIMGGTVSRSDFVWTKEIQPHISRRKQILGKNFSLIFYRYFWIHILIILLYYREFHFSNSWVSNRKCVQVNERNHSYFCRINNWSQFFWCFAT